MNEIAVTANPRHRPLHLPTSTFSCDIGYSDSPTASRASACSLKKSALTISPLRTV